MRQAVAVVIVAVAAVAAVGVFVTMVGRWRATAERVRCQDNLRQISNLYLLAEAKAVNAFPAGTVVVDPKLPPERRLSWVVPGLARLGHGELAAAIDLTAAWDADRNRSAGETFLAQLVCPAAVANKAARDAATLYYPGIAGIGPDAAIKAVDDPGAGMFRYDAPTRVADVKDGLSNTLMLIETADRPGPWIAGGPTSGRPLDPAPEPYIGPGRPFGGTHVGGANTAFADGSGRFFRDTGSPDVLERLAGIADGGRPILRNP
jgi:prepilin-type processing-associated H-X9-DG protein